MQGQTKMAHSLTTGLHLECAIQAEMVVELEAQIHHMQESYEKGSKVCQGQRSCRAKNR